MKSTTDDMEAKMKNKMMTILIALISIAAPVFAASENGAGEGSFLLSLFIGFFALIIVFQLVPAVIMLVGMVRGLFGRDRKKIETHS
jgi:hypothetical protein